MASYSLRPDEMANALKLEARRPSVAPLQPNVAVRCVVCDGARREILCDAAEVRQQLSYLERFHRRRMRPVHNGSGEDPLADRADFTQDYATDIVRCAACGLVFRETRPRAAAITRAYARDHYSADRLEALFASQLELFRGKLDILRRLLAAQERPVIVEIGSFVGGFLAAAGEQGWRVTGLDPGEEVDAFCRQKGLDVVRSTVEEAPIQPRSADCVTIWNTFDQLPHPKAALTAVRQWLRPNGLLVVRVPNGACFETAMRRLHALPYPLRHPMLAALAWNNLLAFPYLCGYSLETLTQLLKPFAFVPVAASGDTLTRLADHGTKPWAVLEERMLKVAWRALARRQPAHAPWLDLYYRATQFVVHATPQRRDENICIRRGGVASLREESAQTGSKPPVAENLDDSSTELFPRHRLE